MEYMLDTAPNIIYSVDKMLNTTQIVIIFILQKITTVSNKMSRYNGRLQENKH